MCWCQFLIEAMVRDSRPYVSAALRRALLSILETYSDSRCVVLDDCPDGSARSIVEAIQDHRIDYLQNPQRLGAVGNIDQSFFRGPMATMHLCWRTTAARLYLRCQSVF
jgi:hypothetical protein